MSKALITEEHLTNIADAIRAKLGRTDTYMPGQMADAISQIHGMPVNQRKTATKNGAVTPDMGYDGLSQVTVNVPNTYTNADEGKVVIGGSLIDQTSKNITSNGTHNTTTHSSVNVNVPNSYTNADEGKVVSGGQLSNQSTRNVSTNGTYDTTRNNQTVVNVPNSYTNADEGKVVSGGQLSSQTPRQAAITANGTYQTQNNSAVTVEVPQTGSTPTLISKTISANGVYDASDDSADGYTGVTVNVPNTYRAGDEGKVVNNGALVSQTVKNITVNGTHSTTTNDEVVVNVPNSYSNADEGKVVDSGALVAQTSRTVTENGTVDTTTNDEVVVNVPNSYTNADEGKVVDGGELVVQTSKIITENGTVDTTTNNEVSVYVIPTFTAEDEGKVVDDGELVEQTSTTKTENGTYDTTTNNEVVVNVQPTLQSKTVTENGTVTADSGYDGLSQVVVNVQGGVALPHILASNICASNQSHSAGISPSWKKFLLMAINSDASNVTLNPDVDIEGSPVTAETTEYHEYSSTGDNRRNYSINVYDISENASDALYADFTTIPAHMSWLYAYVSADFEISKVMTSAEAATSGSNSEDGCVLYGIIDDNSGGTLTAADYTAGTTITTADPGSGYKSSFIVWLEKKGGGSGDVTVEPLSVSQNGTYTAPTGKAYSPVAVSVQPNLQTKTTTQNGTVIPDQGYDGLSQVAVNVQPNLQTKTTTQNGTVTPDQGYYGLSSVVVNVSGGGGGGNLQVKNITENGIILPDSGYDGFSRVVVAVNVGDSGPFSLKTYIETTGTQWIDTGYSVQDNTRFEAVAILYAKSSGDHLSTLYGVRNSDQTGGCCLWIDRKNSYKLEYQWSSGAGSAEFIYMPGCRGVKAEFNITRQYASYLTVNTDISNVNNTRTGSATQSNSLYLFSLNEGGAEYGQLTRGLLRLYRFRIYEGSTLVHEYLPWLDANNVACLKDTVTSNLLYNAGTGAFIYGTD